MRSAAGVEDPWTEETAVARHLLVCSLHATNLHDALLLLTDLSDATLLLADLSGAKLIGTRLNRADLNGANLRDADLRGATVTERQLRVVHSLKGAFMSDGNRRD